MRSLVGDLVACVGRECFAEDAPVLSELLGGRSCSVATGLHLAGVGLDRVGVELAVL